ncbi:DISARM system helicase DrmA [Bacillus swezeyi]|uniref:DISARM system helicase DrmA n=1 Tax=Bacillus swezeyi TaxID=1925020 RepID=UPI002E212E4E|nr:DISARM system helicase DrmA [Bacillus swezeyi]
MDRHKYSEVRDIFVKELKRDLIGPEYNDEDVLTEDPSQAYLTGILCPVDSEVEETEELDEPYLQPLGGSTIENENTETDEETGNEKVGDTKTIKRRQNSLGLKVYVDKKIKNLKAMIRWGEYKKDKRFDEKSNKEISIWVRKVINHTIEIPLDKESYKINLPKKGMLENIQLILKKVSIKGTTNNLLSIFLVNKNIDKTKKKSIYQVSMQISDVENKAIFIPENLARKDKSDFQEYLYRNKPIFAKGFGCAAEWFNFNSKNASVIKTSFIPIHQVEGMSTELPYDLKYGALPSDYFSIRKMAKEQNPISLLGKLDNLADRYSNWINGLSFDSVEDQKSAGMAIDKCEDSLKRIREGIDILRNNSKAYKAFIFMNEVMHTQISMKNYAKNNQVTTLEAELSKENFSWRPFQLAFILQNIRGIIDPSSEDRELVDLLWFPTGGGKTEAYLGIIAFLLGYRRLTRDEISSYNKDGGVTVILRYTLRLLTTQQRDRLTRLISAAEFLRVQDRSSFGESEFSIGFWVGGQVTANKLGDLQETRYRQAWKVRKEYEKIEKQVIECPCCGSKDLKFEYLPNNDLNTEKTGIEIYCKNIKCYYHKNYIPVYLVDEEIYRKAPSIIISTVDKLARLPWDEKTANIFGRVDRYCEKCGYIANGESHKTRHNNPSAKVYQVKEFYPPELIIQDELHLITGPLGTIYGLYETAVENLCTAKIKEKIYPPKYIAATATIKNAGEQVKKVFGRLSSSQFPPSGLSIEDSFFGREQKLEDFPFRLYTGVCVSGQSVKTVVLRVFAVLLQVSETIIQDPKYAKYVDYIDPYRTLIGYFNSIRELGGAVRLLDDDVRKRIQRLKKIYGFPKERYIDNVEELTSRIPSYRIPQILELLDKSTGNNELDVALATNMISVGMDVDRLGLMVVNGQPKQTSEYIQASSRVGRSKPGLVVTVYNPYRPRDLSHYENFKGYHSRLYNYVEGTTATPFAARARDRALHASLVAILRLRNKNLANNKDAINISSINLSELKGIIKKRVSISDNKNLTDTLNDLNLFLDRWQNLSVTEPSLQYYFYPSPENLKKNEVRLLSRFNDRVPKINIERDTLDAMRQIEASSKIYIQEGWYKIEK